MPFSTYSELFVKSSRFEVEPTPPAFVGPVGGHFVRISACIILCFAILIQNWHVTDRQTDGQADGYTTTAEYRASIALHA